MEYIRYKVVNLAGQIYQVIEAVVESGDEAVLFQGSLSDCEAFIRLTEAGYM